MEEELDGTAARRAGAGGAEALRKAHGIVLREFPARYVKVPGPKGPQWSLFSAVSLVQLEGGRLILIPETAIRDAEAAPRAAEASAAAAPAAAAEAPAPQQPGAGAGEAQRQDDAETTAASALLPPALTRFDFPVFTVSSLEFGKLSGLRSSDGEARVFSTVEETEIPALRAMLRLLPLSRAAAAAAVRRAVRGIPERTRAAMAREAAEAEAEAAALRAERDALGLDLQAEMEARIDAAARAARELRSALSEAPPPPAGALLLDAMAEAKLMAEREAAMVRNPCPSRCHVYRRVETAPPPCPVSSCTHRPRCVLSADGGRAGGPPDPPRPAVDVRAAHHAPAQHRPDRPPPRPSRGARESGRGAGARLPRGARGAGPRERVPRPGEEPPEPGKVHQGPADRAVLVRFGGPVSCFPSQQRGECLRLSVLQRGKPGLTWECYRFAPALRSEPALTVVGTFMAATVYCTYEMGGTRPCGAVNSRRLGQSQPPAKCLVCSARPPRRSFPSVWWCRLVLLIALLGTDAVRPSSPAGAPRPQQQRGPQQSECPWRHFWTCLRSVRFTAADGQQPIVLDGAPRCGHFNAHEELGCTGCGQLRLPGSSWPPGPQDAAVAVAKCGTLPDASASGVAAEKV